MNLRRRLPGLRPGRRQPDRRIARAGRVAVALGLLLAALGPGVAVGAVRAAGVEHPVERGVEVRAALDSAIDPVERSAQGARPTTAAEPTSDVPAGPLRDPYRPQQWHLDRLGLDEDRRVPDGRGQVIAVLDSGVDLDHPDLVDVLARTPEGRVLGRDLVDDDDRPQDEFGHGTMVAGIAAARSGNGVGIAGTVSGEAVLLPVRVLDEQGRGSSSVVAAGIDWAIAQGATVVNLSLESAGIRGVADDPELRRAIEDAVAAGAAVVVAAGNTDETVPDPPTGDGVVLVGATDRDDRRAGFSDRGRADLLMAPGVEIVSTWCRTPERATCDGATHTYGIADGTSFAAPQVSGLVAMLASTGLTPIQAIERLGATTIDLGDPGPDAITGRGLVSADTSLGAWPDEPVPVTSPDPVPSPTARSPGPGDASPQAVAPADPPAESGIPTRILVLVAILVAVGLLVHGLTGERRQRGPD